MGAEDIACPPAQSLELWRALSTMGTPATLVIYPGEGHSIRQPRNYADLTRRIPDWFDRHLE